jgi:hypothetical protein
MQQLRLRPTGIEPGNDMHDARGAFGYGHVSFLGFAKT